MPQTDMPADAGTTTHESRLRSELRRKGERQAMNDGRENRPAQELAREAMKMTAAEIRPGMSEAQIAALAEKHMRELGAEGWWYHGVGALTLVGKERSRLSVSGREYCPDKTAVLGENDLVSLDFSPVVNGRWGDYARTVYLEGGKPKLEPEEPETAEFAAGYAVELRLHRELTEWARPETTFHQVWERMNRLLREAGYRNMDFHGNLGHSIERSPDDRIYLEEGNNETLGGHGTPFTFEPHIGTAGGWGFKREEIYVFGEDGRLKPL